MTEEHTHGYDTPRPSFSPIPYDFLFVKSGPQNPMCQVIAPCSPLSGLGLVPTPFLWPRSHSSRPGTHPQLR